MLIYYYNNNIIIIVLDARCSEDSVPNTKEHSTYSCTSWSDWQPKNPWHSGLLITGAPAAARTWSVNIRGL